MTDFLPIYTIKLNYRLKGRLLTSSLYLVSLTTHLVLGEEQAAL